MKAIPECYRGNEAIVARVWDWMDQSERQYRCIITPFLTPLEQSIAQGVIGKSMFVRFWGGYEEAEMKRMALSVYESEEDFAIIALRGSYVMKARRLTHRDVLGAFLHLGLKRDQIGDILVMEQEIIAFVRREMADFITTSLTRIAHETIRFSPYDGEIHYEANIIWHTYSVASMRLDCLVAACIHGARGKASALIKGKCIKVDHLPLEDCKHLCNNNCTISIRGYGRFAIKQSDRISRKGKHVIEIGTYR